MLASLRNVSFFPDAKSLEFDEFSAGRSSLEVSCFFFIRHTALPATCALAFLRGSALRVGRVSRTRSVPSHGTLGTCFTLAIVLSFPCHSPPADLAARFLKSRLAQVSLRIFLCTMACPFFSLRALFFFSPFFYTSP